jgi:hypothetical protein
LWGAENECGEWERANMIRPYQGFFGAYKMDGVMVVFEFN